MLIDVRDLQDVPFTRDAAIAAAAATARHVRLACDHLSLVFVDDLRIADINQRFRGIAGPTDVLTFDLDEDAGEVTGEIIVSAQTAARQAADAGHSLDREIAWLVAHGVLHLAGMDDETQDQLDQMLAIQHQVLARM